MNRCVRFLLVLLTSLSVIPVQGQTGKENLEQRKRALQEEIRQTNQLISETRKNKNASLTQLKALNKKLQDRMRLIGAIQLEINGLSSTISQNSQRIDELQRDLERIRASYAKLVRRAYMTRNQQSALLLVFSASTLQQAYKRLYYLKSYASFRKEQARQIKASQQELDGKVRVLRTDLSTKQQLLGSEVQEKKELSKEKQEREKTVASLSKKEKALRKELSRKEAASKKLDAEIRKVIEREIARERAAMKAKETAARKSGTAAAKPSAGTAAKTVEPALKVSPETAALSGKFEANKGRLPWPVDKGAVTESFGTHPHPVLRGISTVNNGIDIGTTRNARVKAIYDGEVMGVVSIPGSGSAVILKHGEYLSVYSNLSSVSVNKGDKLKTGATIGTAGDNNDGQPEAHLEIWKGKTKLNPELWIAR